MMGGLVAFEGGEGAGKSTQLRLLADELVGRGRDVVITYEPGDTPVGARLRELLLDPATSVTPQTEALLYAADRAEHVAHVIAPALARGAVVLTDRYIDSSIAYQGYGRGLDVGEVTRASLWATGGLRPDLTVLLDLPAEEGLRRARGRNADADADRLESEALDFHARVRAGFLALADADPPHYAVIAADGTPDEVAREVWLAVEGVLTTVGGRA
jgi:dTMP kinase